MSFDREYAPTLLGRQTQRFSATTSCPQRHPLRWMAAVATVVLGGLFQVSCAAPTVAADPQSDAVFQDAREAWRARDRVRLNTDRDALLANGHVLAPWADYWALGLRWSEVSPAEVDVFLAKWGDAYVADRARNDWLLELGRRQDWVNFLRVLPAYKMNDDREVACYAYLARFPQQVPMGNEPNWRDQARQAWWFQKDPDQGCDAMAKGLLAAGVFNQADIWVKLRLALESDKFKTVQQSARFLDDNVAQAVNRLVSQPQALLVGGGLGVSNAGQAAPGAVVTESHSSKSKSKSKHKTAIPPVRPPIPLVLPAGSEAQLNLLAFIRWAGMDTAAAAQAIQDPANRTKWRWDAEQTGWAWSQLGRSSAWRLMNDAPSYFSRAVTERSLALGMGELKLSGARTAVSWSPETLAWMARAGLRAATAGDASAWALVDQAIDAMAPDQQADLTWVYWRAKSLQARAASAGSEGAKKAMRDQARALLMQVANPLTFYGQLAQEELQGTAPKPPATPAALTEAELTAARSVPGVVRALKLFDLGWRSEAVREWNYTVSWGKPTGWTDRELLAISELACQREIWDRCINTSERTKQDVSLAQRYPTPFRSDVLTAAKDVGLDPAYMYGLIRQESRFIVNARSGVGAAGLMQVMPATATWTAKKLSINYSPEMLTDRLTNLRLGAGYLKLVLDDLQGMQALAAAAYNAGPSRPRRWREGATVDAAAWVENVPFTETRDYVKKVLSNAVVYGQVLQGRPMSIKSRLGSTVGPRAASAPATEGDLP